MNLVGENNERLKIHISLFLRFYLASVYLHSLQDPSKTMSFGGVPTGVFWDIEDCKIGDALSLVEVSRNIKKSLSHVGIDATEVSIRAYGDGKNHDFNSVGIPLTHSSPGEKVARHKQILVDVLTWARENPAPANFVLIMGDTLVEFENVIFLLQALNYRYLLAHP